MGLFLIIVITTAAFGVGEGGLVHYTRMKNKKNFLIDKEIQIGAVAKSYMTNGLLIYV
jgi:hypothetical protein